MAVHIEYEGKSFQFADGTSPQDAFAQAAEMYSSLPQSTAPVEDKPRKSMLDLMKDGNREELYQRGNPQSLYDAAVGSAQEFLNVGDKGKSRFKAVDARTKRGMETGLLDHIKGAALAAADVGIGGTLGMLGAIGKGAVYGIGSGSAARGLNVGKETLHALTPSVLLGVDDEKNPSYEALMAPFAALSEVMALAGQGYGEIAHVLGASDNFKKELSAAIEGSLLIGMFGHSAKKAYTEWKENVPPTEAKIAPDTPKADIEKELLKRTKKHLNSELDKMKKFQQELEFEFERGNTTKELVDLSEALKERIAKSEQDIASFEFDTTGKNPPVEKSIKDIQEIQLALDKKLQMIEDIDAASRQDGAMSKDQYTLKKTLLKEVKDLQEQEKSHPDYGKEQVPLRDLTTRQEEGLDALETKKVGDTISPPKETPIEPLQPLAEDTPFVGPLVPSQAVKDVVATWTPQRYIENVIPKLKNSSLVREGVAEVLNNFKNNKTTPRQ